MAKFVEKYKENKRAYITIRTDENTRKAFNQIAKSKGTTAVNLLRQFIKNEIMKPTIKVTNSGYKVIKTNNSTFVIKALDGEQ